MTNITQIKPQPSPFDELKVLWPSDMRGNVQIARQKYNQITGNGLQTKVLDKDSGGYVDIFLQASHEEIMEGARNYLKGMRDRETYKLSVYTVRLQNWLNRGMWET